MNVRVKKMKYKGKCKMKKIIIYILYLCSIIVLFVPFSFAEGWHSRAIEDINRNQVLETNIKIAWIYGSSIVIAAIAIGFGLFFGLRSMKNK